MWTKQALGFAFFAILLVASRASEAENFSPVVSIEDVSLMMDQVPATELSPRWRKAAWHKIHDGRAVAHAITLAARSRKEAALMVVYAIDESANTAHARGDFDKKGHATSLGAWQVQDTLEEIAFDPDRAVFVWRAKADDSRFSCPDNPPETALAKLASGHCDRGVEKVRARDALASDIESATNPAVAASP